MSDVDIDLKLTTTGDIKILKGIDAVRNQIAVIFNTIRGEIPMHPHVGSALYHMLFTAITETTTLEVENYLRSAVQNSGNLKVVDFQVTDLDRLNKHLRIYLSVVDTVTGDYYDFMDMEVPIGQQ